MRAASRFRRLTLALAASACCGTGALAADEVAPWQEADVEPPAFPDQSRLVDIYVSAASTNRFLVDPATLSVGPDGVVRYVLVVLTSGGATNVSFEGIRCKEWAWKVYATGRPDRSWSKARIAEWRPIENKPVNRHHTTLARELFCPYTNPVRDADEARDALRRGKHPSVN